MELIVRETNEYAWQTIVQLTEVGIKPESRLNDGRSNRGGALQFFLHFNLHGLVSEWTNRRILDFGT